MTTEKICGSTLDHAEIIVDYRKTGDKKIQIKGVPKETKSNVVHAAYKEWFFFLAPYFVVLGFIDIGLILISPLDILAKIGLWFHLEKDKIILINSILIFVFWVVISLILSLFHLNKEFDKKWRKWFVLRTEREDKNKATFSNFKSKVFAIYDFRNTVLNYDSSGDVEKQLYMIWIKEEPYSSIYKNHAGIKRISFAEKRDAIWNAYFFFEEVPKDGELCLEWI